MDFSHLLHSSIPQSEKLLDFGFIQKEEGFVFKQDLNAEFYATVVVSSEKITALAFEKSTDEKYILLDVPSAHGAFVGNLRELVTNLICKIHENCFICADIKEKYIEWIQKDLGVNGDYPWEDDNTSAVYRCKSGKWFALVMKIKFKNLGFTSDDPVWAVNLKADYEKIPELVDKKSIFPAWHMNKKYWITVMLTAVTDFEKLKALTLRSKQLVEK